MRILWIAPLCLTLTACGGSDTPVTTIPTPSEPAAPTTPTTPPTGGAETGTAMRSAANALLNTYADPVDFTTLSSIPASVTATYDGYAYGTLANTSDGVTDTLMGQLSLTIALTASDANISGQIDNFVDDADNALSGALDITSGTFNRSGDPQDDATLTIGFAGDLVDGAQTLNFGGQWQGDFLAAGRQGVGGILAGSVTAAGNTQAIDGGFIAER